MYIYPIYKLTFKIALLFRNYYSATKRLLLNTNNKHLLSFKDMRPVRQTKPGVTIVRHIFVSEQNGNVLSDCRPAPGKPLKSLNRLCWKLHESRINLY